MDLHGPQPGSIDTYTESNSKPLGFSSLAETWSALRVCGQGYTARVSGQSENPSANPSSSKTPLSPVTQCLKAGFWL
jgi:hypothetical protein